MNYHYKFIKYKSKYTNLKKGTGMNADIQKILTSDIHPRFGLTNPELVDNYFWKYMIQHPEYDAYTVEQIFNLQRTNNQSIFTFERMGCAKVKLKDGRIIYVGGEHEDFYDPNFYIYNDVIVLDGNNIYIYLYPADIFPPTENAKLKENNGKLIISRGSRYHPLVKPNEITYKRMNEEPDYILDLKTFKIVTKS
jgi:hypothetical protein